VETFTCLNATLVIDAVVATAVVVSRGRKTSSVATAVPTKVRRSSNHSKLGAIEGGKADGSGTGVFFFKIGCGGSGAVGLIAGAATVRSNSDESSSMPPSGPLLKVALIGFPGNEVSSIYVDPTKIA
jgi:N-methylhydantoinase B/oxoprolinase/acetone carboxylase alpha subunit